MEKIKPTCLYTHKTSWCLFQTEINSNLEFFLKAMKEIEDATLKFTNSLENAAWKATPAINENDVDKPKLPSHILTKITEKRRLRKILVETKYPPYKTKYNKAF